MQRISPRRALTLIELIVVVAIIAIFIGLLLPAVQKVGESANRARCANNLKQLALAVHDYEAARERMPVYLGVDPAPNALTQSGNPVTSRSKVHGSWFVHLLPYVEQGNLYDRIQSNLEQNAMNEPTYTTPPVSSGGGTTTTYKGGHTGIEQETWRRLLLPRDGQAVSFE